MLSTKLVASFAFLGAWASIHFRLGLQAKAKTKLRAHALAFRAVPLPLPPTAAAAAGNSAENDAAAGRARTLNPWVYIDDAARRWPMRTRQEAKEYARAAAAVPHPPVSR